MLLQKAYVLAAAIVYFRKSIFNIIAMLYPPLKLMKIFTVVTSTSRISEMESMQKLNMKMFQDLSDKIHDINNPV